MQISTELKRDVRIFTGSNAIIFLLLLVISFLKPQAIKHLFLPGYYYLLPPLCVHFSIFLNKIGFFPLSMTITMALLILAL